MTENGRPLASITWMAAMQNGKLEQMKSVFITGAASGTGFAIAERFARDGWAVFIGSRDLAKAREAAEVLSDSCQIPSHGFETRIFDEENTRQIFSEIRTMGFDPDALVLNAANLGIGQVSLDVGIPDFMQVFQTNIGWNFMIAREAARGMIRKGKGSIVIISSNSAVRVTRDRCAYCSSKAALLAMSKSFAVDWGRYGIRSNVILPGMIKTERWENNLNGARESLANYTPIGDIASFEDIAEAALFLAGDHASRITGAELVVDGGMLAQLTPDPGMKPFFINPQDTE